MKKRSDLIHEIKVKKKTFDEALASSRNIVKEAEKKAKKKVQEKNKNE